MNFKLLTLLTLRRCSVLALNFSFIIQLNAAIIHVPADFATIQSAIDTAAWGEFHINPDTIEVAEGTYLEHIRFKGKNVVVTSNYMFNNDPQIIEATIIDGNSSGPVVTFKNQETLAAVLNGFTITNGMGKIVGGHYYSGGITCIRNSSPTLNNLIITNNQGFRGGGIKTNRSDLVILNSVISYNTAVGDPEGYHHGGGVSFVKSRFKMINCSIIGNTAYSNAGGLYYGGGAYNSDGPYYRSAVNNCVIEGNYAHHDGGGVGMSGCPGTTFKEVIIRDNTAAGYGGGVQIWTDAVVYFDQVEITDNHASLGSGVIVYQADPIFNRLTLSANTLGYGIEV